MRLPIPLTIGRKLTLIMLAACAVALIVAITALVVFDSISERQQILDRVEAQVSFIAANSAPALVFNQHDLAFDLLDSLKNDPYIAVGCIYNSETNLVAHHVTTDLPSGYTLPSTLDSNRHDTLGFIDIVRPISLGNEIVGYVYLLGDLTPLKQRLRNLAGVGILVLLFAFGIAALVSSYLQRFISQPIVELTAIANTVTRTKDYSFRAPNRPGDELGRLIEIFNEMLQTIQTRESALKTAHHDLEERVEERTKKLSSTNESLKTEIGERKKARSEVVQLNSKLIETTRRAGMAEVASGVLHNVGNVLNSVNVSTGVIRRHLEESEIDQFKAVITLLKEHRDSLDNFLVHDHRGKKIPDYLEAYVHHLQHEETLLKSEVDSLAKNIDHIKEIIATQQRHAVGIGITERQQIDQLVDEVVTIYAEPLKQARILMIAEYESCPEIVTDKHKVIQILGNLILNARDALAISRNSSKEIHIKTRSTAEQRVAIQVRDNGVGIKTEELKWIFTYGFTTKKEGHGLGLHSCAIAAQELNGSLRVLSEGQSKGATFILELPIE
jgi:two-component system, NtrC family, sensor kinase